MRFLIDECLPPSMAALLRAAGHVCAHVYELGLGGRPDEQIMDLADRQDMRHTTRVFLISGVPVRFADQGTESVAVSRPPLGLPRPERAR